MPRLPPDASAPSPSTTVHPVQRAGIAEPGQVLGGRWVLESRLGAGSFSEVWMARHHVSGGAKAIKLLRPGLSDLPAVRDRFVHEAQAASRVNSPHVVTVDDIDVDGPTGWAYLVMEPLRGESLHSYLSHPPFRMPREDVVPIVWQIADALDAAHEAGIVHRDVKPENVFLTWSEEGDLLVKVLDFGIAKLLGAATDPAEWVDLGPVAANRTLGFLGTPGYAAPEQIRDARHVTRAADVFALGVCAFEMLTARPYWRSHAPVAVLSEILIGVTEPPSCRAPEGVVLPPAFDDWFLRACASEPGERFPSAGDAAAALQRALGVHDDTASPPPRVQVPLVRRTSGRYRVSRTPRHAPPQLEELLTRDTEPPPASVDPGDAQPAPRRAGGDRKP